MNQEKLEKATKYMNLMKSKLSDPTSQKHSNRSVQYRAFLERELKKATTNVESLKLDAAGKK